MKKLFAVAALALGLLGIAGAASADPSAQLCHDIHVNVNGDDLVNDAACTVLPPQ